MNLKTFLLSLFILSIFGTPLFAEITNIQYEGTWDRSSYYDWGFDIKNDTLYVGAHSFVERYKIDENGDLELLDYLEISGIMQDLRVDGDSLYVVTGGESDSTRVRIVDISNGNMEVVFNYPVEELFALDHCIFTNARYALFCADWPTVASYYYDKQEDTFSEITFPIYLAKALIGDYFFDLQQNTGELRIRDISDIDNPETVYVGEPISPDWTYISVLDDTTIIFTDTASDKIVFYNISDITNLQEISSITMETTQISNPAIPVGNNSYLLLTTWSSGERFLYNIEDLENPYLECSWLIKSYTSTFKSIAYNNYFYTKRGDAGIAKYDVELLPITEPLAYFGITMQSEIYCRFDGQRVIIYRRDKIITKETPDDEGTIIYQDPAIDYCDGGFSCNDSLTIVTIIDWGTGTMDLKIIETATGEILNSIDNFPYFREIKYIEPYFYFNTYNSSHFRVYKVNNEWELELVSSITLPEVMVWVGDCPGNYVWITGVNTIYIYDTTDFELVSSFPHTAFVPSGATTPYPAFFNDLLYIRYGYGYDYNEFARLYSFDLINDPILIDEAAWGEYNILHPLEDSWISARRDKPALLYLFSEDGFSEPYDEYFFNGHVSWFIMDEEHNRIFVKKGHSFDSFTYDYVSSVPDHPDIEEGITISNFPNPFSTYTTISFNIPTNYTNLDEEARIKIYNIKGQLVKQFNPPAGGQKFKISGEAVWDGRDSSGKPVPSGVYLYRITTDSFTSETKKMILIK